MMICRECTKRGFDNVNKNNAAVDLRKFVTPGKTDLVFKKIDYYNMARRRPSAAHMTELRRLFPTTQAHAAVDEEPEPEPEPAPAPRRSRARAGAKGAGKFDHAVEDEELALEIQEGYEMLGDDEADDENIEKMALERLALRATLHAERAERKAEALEAANDKKSYKRALRKLQSQEKEDSPGRRASALRKSAGLLAPAGSTPRTFDNADDWDSADSQ